MIILNTLIQILKKNNYRRDYKIDTIESWERKVWLDYGRKILAEERLHKNPMNMVIMWFIIQLGQFQGWKKALSLITPRQQAHKCPKQNKVPGNPVYHEKFGFYYKYSRYWSTLCSTDIMPVYVWRWDQSNPRMEMKIPVRSLGVMKIRRIK